MIDIIISFIDLFKIGFNKLFNLKIELVQNQEISIGALFVGFVLFIGIIYLISKYVFGINKGDD